MTFICDYQQCQKPLRPKKLVNFEIVLPPCEKCRQPVRSLMWIGRGMMRCFRGTFEGCFGRAPSVTLPSEFRTARGLRTFSVTGYGKSELAPVFFFGQSSLGPQVYERSNAGQSNFSVLKMSFMAWLHYRQAKAEAVCLRSM